MVEKANTDDDSKDADSGQGNVAPNHLKGVLIGGGLAVLGLLLASIYWPNLTERTKFFTGNLLNLVIAIAVIAQVLINRKQWQVMQDGLERTDKVIKHMEAQVTEMQLQHVTNQGQIMLAVEAVEASKRSAKAAEDSVSVARDNMVYGQRAYVIVKSGSVQMAGDVALFSLRITNSGNTPANDVRIFAVAEVAANPPVAIDMRAATWTRAGVVAPHTEIIRLVVTKEDISSAQWQLIAKEELGVYVWGAVEYKDVFPGTDPHQTKFSLAQRFGGTDLGPCDTNNEAF